MSIRLVSASSQYAERTASTWDANADYTVTAWVKMQAFDTASWLHPFLTIRRNNWWDGWFDSIEMNFDVGINRVMLAHARAWSGGPTSGSTSLSTGTWYFCALVRSGTTYTLYLDGVSAATTTRISNSDATTAFSIGRGESDYQDCHLAFINVWTRALTTGELDDQELQGAAVSTTNLWGSWSMRTNADDESGNSRNLTTYGTPTFSETDDPVPYESGYELIGSPAGSFAVAWPTAGVNYSRRADSGVGAFDATWPTAGAAYARTLAGEVGAFAVAWPSATAAVGYVLAGQPGAFDVAWPTAGAAYARALAGEAGAFAVGWPSSTAAQNYAILGQPGAFAAAWPSAGGAYARLVAGEAGAFVVAWPNTGGAWARQQDGQPGAFVLAWPNASVDLAGTLELDGQPGAFAVAWPTASAVWTRQLAGEAGAFDAAWPTSGAAWARQIAGEPGSFAIAWPNTAAVLGYALAGQPGAITLTLPTSGAAWSRTVGGEPGSYSFAWPNATVNTEVSTLELLGDPAGAFAVAWPSSGAVWARQLATVPGSYAAAWPSAGALYLTETTVRSAVVLQRDFLNVVGSPTAGWVEVEVTRDADGKMRFWSAP